MLWNVKQVLWFQNAISSLDCKYLYGKDDEDSIVHELCLLYNYLKRKSSIQAELPEVFGYTYITQTNAGENEVMRHLLFRPPSPAPFVILKGKCGILDRLWTSTELTFENLCICLTR